MSNSITPNERAALKSALATGGHIRFEIGGKRHPTITVVEGVTVVTQSTLDLQMSMESRGWLIYVGPPHLYDLTSAGTTKAKRLR